MQKVTVREPTPSQYRPTGYHDILVTYNTNNLNQLTDQLNEMTHGEDYVIAVTGSDGRFEKSQMLSPIELLVITNNTSTDLSKIYSLQDTAGFENRFETIELGEDNPLFYSGNRNSIYPSRVFDSRPLSGDPSLHEAYIKSAFNKLAGEESKRYLRRTKRTLELAQQTLKDGSIGRKNAKIPCVIMRTGELLYDPINYVKATKNGFLRTAQYKISHDIAKAIAEERIDLSTIEQMPRNVTQRLDYFNNRGLLTLNERDLGDIVHAYQHALYWHHLAEENYNQGIQTLVDKDDLNEVADIINRFSRKPLLR